MDSGSKLSAALVAAVALCVPATANAAVLATVTGDDGKKFRTLGKGKVNSKGTFKVRFHLPRGTYRIRYSFKGSSTVAKGTVYEVIKITRRLG
jgi:predicted porin